MKPRATLPAPRLRADYFGPSLFFLSRSPQTANVLLDTELGSAKIADFGTARKGVSHAGDKTHATTALVAGTKCYMPPEVSSSAQ